jgi:beta-phosphoglucomutase-like phosphatase (HAD superfamily)/8-oxo-dGTP pyrophosphatase MutT (NUDIX family)
VLKALLVDLDGTLIDSLSLLYRVYEEFLARYGKKGTEEEFQSLNGLTLLEVMQELTKRHGIDASPEKLSDQYKARLDGDYGKSIKLFPLAKECLAFAKALGLKVAIVTSAKRKLAEMIVQRNQLNPFIDAIITAEGLAKGKPHPEIYQKALHELEVAPEEALALEDAPHGMESARAAGIEVFAVCPKKGSFHEVIALLKKQTSSFEVFPIASDFSLHCQEGQIKDDPRIDEIWEAELKNARLFDGQILSLLSFEEHSLLGEFVSYRDYVAQMRGLDLNVKPVSVSGIVRYKDSFLLGKRADSVSMFPSHYELAPAGSVDPSELNLKKIFLKELKEETGIVQVETITPFAIAYDKTVGTFEILARIDVKDPTLTSNWEYSELIWVKQSELLSFLSKPLVPFSRFLLTRYCILGP